MNAVQAPGRFALAFRALSAMVLTGILSALLVAVGIALVSSLQPGRATQGFAGLGDFISFIWFIGSLVATACAIVLGLFVEWPKAWWQAKRSSGGFGVHLLMSLAAAEVLLLGWTMVSEAVRHTPVRDPDFAKGLFFVAVVAAVGGACSAALWWRLVVLPMRRARLRDLGTSIVQ